MERPLFLRSFTRKEDIANFVNINNIEKEQIVSIHLTSRYLPCIFFYHTGILEFDKYNHLSIERKKQVEGIYKDYSIIHLKDDFLFPVNPQNDIKPESDFLAHLKKLNNIN